MSARARVLVAATAALVAGCTALLPSADNVVHSKWQSFEEARAALETVAPQRTTLAEVHALGLDPYADPNVELLNYSDILRRFPLASSKVKLDAGLQQCLDAGKACTGYAIDIRNAHQKRVGNFFLDFLSFQRQTKSTGWSFNALVLVVDDRVVYSLYGGKPAVSEMAKTTEPLGPVQNWNGSGLIR